MRLKLLKQVTRNLRKSEYSQSPFPNLQKKEAVVGEKTNYFSEWIGCKLLKELQGCPITGSSQLEGTNNKLRVTSTISVSHEVAQIKAGALKSFEQANPDLRFFLFSPCVFHHP